MAKPPAHTAKKSTPSTEAHAFQDEVAEEISKRISALVPSAQRGQVIAQVVSLITEERFSGPIAHPKHLREYEEICPGAADRIMRMAENNMAHHHAMQEKAVTADVDDLRNGRRYGFAALALLFVGAVFSVWWGNTTLALAFLGTGALGTVGHLIKGRGQSNGD